MFKPPSCSLVGLAWAALAGVSANAPGQFPADFLVEDMVGRGAQMFVGWRRLESAGRAVGSGDVNADGFRDLLITSTGAETSWGGDLPGVVYVVFGGPTLEGQSVISLNDLDGTNGFRIEHHDPYANFGRGLIADVDVNRDGLDDFVVSAHGAWALGQPAAGQVYVIYGAPGLGATGTFKLLTLNGSNGFVINGPGRGQGTGSLLGAGDFNADGWTDLGMYASGVGGRGRIYVLWGRSGLGSAGVVNLGQLAPGEAMRVDGLLAGDGFGPLSPRSGDPNADGMDDLLLGASLASPNGIYRAGQVYVVFGRRGLEQLEYFPLNELNGSNGYVINGSSPEMGLGGRLAAVGDVNDDGHDDIMMSSSSPSSNILLFGGPGVGASGIIEAWQIEGDRGFQLYRSSSLFGPAGDVNHDGVADLMTGLLDYDASRRYMAGVLYGQAGLGPGGALDPPLLDPRALDGTRRFLVRSTQVANRLGLFGGIGDIGDLNSDGMNDVVVTDVAYSLPGPIRRQEGAVYVIFGRRLGDLDLDADVDLADFLIFAQCFAGAGAPPTPACPTNIVADLDYDGDVDLADFLIFQQNFTGSR